MRSHFANVKDVADGALTPLGTVETWSPSLKSVFGILLNSGCPMFLVWDYTPLPSTSSKRILFYNEAYLSLLNETQRLNPFGQRDDHWTENWRMIQADVEQVLTTGQALQRQQNPIFAEQNGKNNELLYSYSAVWDEMGQIRGVCVTGCRVSDAETDFISSLHDLDEGYFSLSNEISDRQKIEQNRERFLNVGSDLLVITNINGYFQWVSPTFERTLGWTVAEMISRPWTDFVHPDDISTSILEMDSLFSGNETIGFENRYRHKDGSYRWFLWRAQPYPAEQVIYGAAIDITDRKQAEAEQKRLLEVLTTERTRFEAVLHQMPEGVIIADAASEAMVLANERTNQILQYAYELNFELSEYEQQAPFQAYRPNGQVYASHEYPLMRSLRTGEIVDHEEMTLRYLNGRHLVIEANAAPILDEQGKVTAAIVLIQDITERKQAEAEREQLLLQEQATRAVAEAAEQRAEFLAAASETLASSLDYEYTLKSVAQAVVPTLADWCAVDILKDDGTLERLATAHVDPAKVEWGLELHRRYPPDLNAPRGIAQVLRTGQSEYYPTISDNLIVASARDDEHLKILRELGFSSLMLVPLNARGRTLGTISFVATESGYSYRPEDLSLAEELARRAAIALDNARLYQEAQQARQAAERAADRTSRLQMVTAALSESLTPEQVAEVIVEQSMATLEATAALVVLVSNNRTELEIVKSVGYQTDLVEAWRRFSINTDVPLAEAIRTGKPVWIETLLDRITRYPHLAEIYNRYEFNAWIALPLVVEGKSIGGMLLSFTEFRLLNQEDRDFILALTQQCAQAIVRAQLYDAERQARAEAEQANRIKDEFLAVLSHELRSPLNPILGWSRLLQTRPFDQAGTKRALETIERNAKLQTQLIDDLLDVSRILRGKLVLDGCPTNLVNVIDAAFETVRLSAETKGITIQKMVEGEVGLTLGDAGRLQQVVWNLLSNAVKFTSEGGQIEIRLEQIDNKAQIQVIDTGKGINPEFLPHVFEYFRQEDGATTRRFGGLGLGLAIVRHLVELHGGTVQAASPGEGKGATFTVRLPLLRNTEAQIDTTGFRDLSFSIRQPLANVQVLVVDDEPDSREFVAFVLEQAGATVLTATTAAEALTMFMRVKPNVLLSDIGMPEMDGYMLMQQVRALPIEQGGQVPAIALTAYAGEMNRQQALAAGFHHHLAKPIEPEVLVKAIVVLLHPT